MSDLVGNPEDRFSRVAVHMVLMYSGHSLIQHHNDCLNLKIAFWFSQLASDFIDEVSFHCL